MLRKSGCCGRRKDAAKAWFCNMREFFRAVFPALPKASSLSLYVKQKSITAQKREQKAPLFQRFSLFFTFSGQKAAL